MAKHPRTIGTTENAISAAEAELGFRLPASFRQWLIENNGLGIEDISIFPVFDDRDPRKTWNSIVREREIATDYWSDVFGNDGKSFSDLLPFAAFGTGDYYCFDFSQPSGQDEYVVVHVSHETGECTFRANSFAEFAAKAAQGEFECD